MTTIDKLDLSVYNLYAIRTRMLEQINQQFRLDQASSIPPQTQVLDISPKMTEIDLLMGIVPVQSPWAFFFPPKDLRYVRRSPFAFHRIVPSLGTDEEEQADRDTLAKIICKDEEEEMEKAALTRCLEQIEKINSWMSFIIGRVGQFLQG